MNKSRRTQPILVLVNDMADIEAVRVRAYDERNDELLGFVEAIRFAINLGIVGLPVEAQFLDSPDVVLESAGKRIAVEVTRIAWTRQSAAIAGTTDKFPDAIVEMSAHLCDQGGAEGRLGDRTGSYAAIKRRHERLDSPGSCPSWWCRSGAPWRVGPPCQVAMAGRLTGAVSLTVPRVSRLM
jgi:hypothetical protein